ncbi:hypothetical protein INT48_007505 [Thamnidium elegans]|uniref:Uncharacterized protein n=1 Tax=Thamnidium elegans TaxID=101142 RepID=A0A8H7VSF4_9FUNG|nr:hypothetical protein INT48_007505 [Thamnidium elegans]
MGSIGSTASSFYPSRGRSSRNSSSARQAEYRAAGNQAGALAERERELTAARRNETLHLSSIPYGSRISSMRDSGYSSSSR